MCMSVLSACTCVYMYVHVCTTSMTCATEKVGRPLWNWNYRQLGAAKCVRGTKISKNCWAISSAPNIWFLYLLIKLHTWSWINIYWVKRDGKWKSLGNPSLGGPFHSPHWFWGGNTPGAPFWSTPQPQNTLLPNALLTLITLPWEAKIMLKCTLSNDCPVWSCEKQLSC